MDTTRMAESPDEVEQVVQRWQRAAPRLAEVRRREVSELTDAEVAAATMDLFIGLDALEPLPPRPTH